MLEVTMIGINDKTTSYFEKERSIFCPTPLKNYGSRNNEKQKIKVPNLSNTLTTNLR